jgi:hypothetical protein
VRTAASTGSFGGTEQESSGRTGPTLGQMIMIEETKANHVRLGVNVLLTLAFAFQSFVTSFLFKRKDLTKGKAHLSEFPFMSEHPVIQLIVGLGATVVAIILFVWILQQVWNRVLSGRLGIQQLAFSDAYAISILFFAITSFF